MHSGIYADTELRAVAITFARNNVGAQIPLDKFLLSEGITDEQYDQLEQNSQFKQYVEFFEQEFRKNGFSFSAKSRILAEDLLPDAYHMAKDINVPPAVRAKMMENLVEWGDLKPKKDVSQLAVGAGFSITINLPDMPQKEEKLVIEHEEIEEVPKKRKKRAKITKNTVSEPIKPAKNALKVLENKPKLSISDLFEEAEDYEYAGDDVL
jgi:hypothetical protein